MPELLVRGGGPTADGPVVRVTPASAGWTYVGFEVHRLAAGERRVIKGVGLELCLVILGGQVDVDAGPDSWSGVGGRANVFDGLPHAIYVSAGLEVSFTATTASAEVAVGVAPGWTPGPARLIAPDAIQVEVRGRGEFERFVRPILMDDSPADSLLVVEVITPAGHWSSFPPHKHDRDDPPRETLLEETYYHRIRPDHGFGLQRVYTDDGEIDEAVTFGDGDVVLVPRGYHTVSAPPGYDVYYLNVMAGPTRHWSVVDDPAHAWIKQAPRP
jgi:5-deoxy-glucuronate isomerase